MSEEIQAPATTASTDQQGALLPIVTAAAAIVAALIAMIVLFLMISVANDVSSLHSQARKISHAVATVEEQMVQLKAVVEAPPQTAANRMPAPRPTHIDADDSATDCIVRPGSKNPLADCLK